MVRGLFSPIHISGNNYLYKELNKSKELDLSQTVDCYSPEQRNILLFLKTADYITMFTKACHWILLWDIWGQYKLSHSVLHNRLILFHSVTISALDTASSHNIWIKQSLRVRSFACSQAGDWEDWPDWVWRFWVCEPTAHVTWRLCVTSRLGPPFWWHASDVRPWDEGRWQWQRTRHPASDVLPSVTLGHSNVIYI